MALSKKNSLSSIKTLTDKPNPTPNPTPPITAQQIENFGKINNTTDTKEIAKYLMKKRLVGADLLYTDHPDISSKEGIINAQSDWKASAISKMLTRARSLNLRTPTQLKANQEALLGSLDQRYKDAIRHPAFNQIHPNFWSVFSDITKDRYDAESAPIPAPTPSPLVAALTKK